MNTNPAGRGPAVAGALRAWRGLRWYLRALLGADAYDRYLQRAAREHPGEPVLTARQFWRRLQDETVVRQRCC